MRSQIRVAFALVLGGLAVCGAASAPAGEAPAVLVVPGRPGVPVMWFGRDISGAVVEGEFGLDRPGHGEITIIPAGPPVVWGPGAGGYYPATGHAPRYGRQEVEPPADRPRPPPAETYSRHWGAQSEPLPATSPPPYDQPPIIVAPQINQQSGNQPPANQQHRNYPRQPPRPVR